MKPILQQDDCAPDALEYFEKAFLEKFGEDFSAWRKSARKIIYDDEDYTLEYRKGNLRAIFEAGSPWWEVYNIDPKENPEFWADEQKRCYDSPAYHYNNYCRKPDGELYTPEIFAAYQSAAMTERLKQQDVEAYRLQRQVYSFLKDYPLTPEETAK